MPLAGTAATNDWQPQTAAFDDLLFYAQRSGTTTDKLERKHEAEKELDRRGAASMEFLIMKSHIENPAIFVRLDALLATVPASNAIPALAKGLDAPEGNARKAAAWFMSRYPNPAITHRGVYENRLRELLADEDAAGPAARALGKWQVTNAIPALLPLLQDPKEGRRITAANALRDIGDPAALPHLQPLLDDPYFTVREVAARALRKLNDTSPSKP